MNRRIRSGAALAALLVPVLLAAGCAGDASPADQVPGLAARLDAVDQAVAAHDDGATRTAITRLEHTVYDARQSGDLDQQRADEILSASEALLKALPGAETTPSGATSPSPSSEPSPTQPTDSTPAPPGGEKAHKPPKPPKHDEHGHGHEKEH